MKRLFAIATILLLTLTSYAKEYLIDSVQIPPHLITKAADDCDSIKITELVLFMEVYAKDTGEILLRSDGQSFGGNKESFDFGKYGNVLDVKDEDFPLIIRILVGPQKGVERTARGLAGGGVGAVIGGVIGGIGAGVISGGLGAPAGAAIGAAIGGAIGGGAAAIAPVSNSKEVISFEFQSESGFIGTQKKSISMSNDILSDGKEAAITIKEK